MSNAEQFTSNEEYIMCSIHYHIDKLRRCELKRRLR